jgi:hypothetical protein
MLSVVAAATHTPPWYESTAVRTVWDRSNGPELEDNRPYCDPECGSVGRSASRVIVSGLNILSTSSRCVCSSQYNGAIASGVAWGFWPK